MLVGLALFAAPHPIHRWLLDSFIFLDGGWRILNGQRPYLDFPSALGPVIFQLTAFGMVLSGGGAVSIDLGLISAGAVIGVWAWFLFRGRMGRSTRLLLALFASLFAFSPHAIGSRPSVLTHASIYNRLGYSLLTLVVIEVFRPTNRPDRRAELAGGVSSGIACSLLFFTKPSFGLIAAAFLAGSYVFVDRRDTRRTLGLLGGWAVPTMLMLAYLRFELGTLARTILRVAGNRIQPMGDPRLDVGLWPYVKHAADHLGSFAGLVLLGLVVSSLPRPARVRHCNDWWPAIAAVAVCAAECLLVMTNGTQYSVPLVGVFAWVLASEIQPVSWSPAGGGLHRYTVLSAVSLLGALLLILPDFGGDLVSSVYAASQSVSSAPAETCFAPRLLRGLKAREVPADWDEPSTDRYIRQVNEGADLLQRSSTRSESVFTLDYVNPFSYALERRPAVGGGPYTLSHIFNSGNRPSAEWFLGQTDILMVPKDGPYPKRVAWLDGMFGPFIRQRFVLAGESPSWRMYRRCW